jgi:anti-anti-sigma regulatory factor
VNGQKKRPVKSKRVPLIKRAPQPERRPQPKAAPQPEPLQLESRLTITQAAGLHRTLVARLADGVPIALDGSRVEEIDTAILQLLASLWRTAYERGTPCTWRGTSEVLRRNAILIGVAEALHFADCDPVRDRDRAAT